MNSNQLVSQISQILEEHKAKEILVLDVQKLTSITDTMIICSGTSTRHLKALREYIVVAAKKNKFTLLGTEGEKEAEWILIDLGDAVVHLMLPAVRKFYNLEGLWGYEAA